MTTKGETRKQLCIYMSRGDSSVRFPVFICIPLCYFSHSLSEVPEPAGNMACDINKIRVTVLSSSSIFPSFCWTAQVHKWHSLSTWRLGGEDWCSFTQPPPVQVLCTQGQFVYWCPTPPPPPPPALDHYL